MENSHQLQVEHVTRGGAESSRLQSTEAYERLNTNLQSYGGQIASARLETIERLTNVHQNFNIKNAASESAGFKKKKIDRANSATENDPTALHRLQYRERQLSLPRNSGGAIFKHYIKCA